MLVPALKVKVVLVLTIGCLTEHWTRPVFANRRHKETHRRDRDRDSGHIVKIRTRGAVNFSQPALNDLILL